jgi:mono/diheme cytochrome c family protein
MVSGIHLPTIGFAPGQISSASFDIRIVCVDYGIAVNISMTVTQTAGTLLPRSTVKLARFSVVALFVVAAFAGFAVAQAAPSDDQKYSATLTNNPIYQKNCAKCHGKTAEGRHPFGGPSLISDKTTGASADDLRAVITNGKGHMPKYSGKLATDQIQTLVEQIKAAAKK